MVKTEGIFKTLGASRSPIRKAKKPAVRSCVTPAAEIVIVTNEIKGVSRYSRDLTLQNLK